MNKTIILDLTKYFKWSIRNQNIDLKEKRYMYSAPFYELCGCIPFKQWFYTNIWSIWPFEFVHSSGYGHFERLLAVSNNVSSGLPQLFNSACLGPPVDQPIVSYKKAIAGTTYHELSPLYFVFCMNWTNHKMSQSVRFSLEQSQSMFLFLMLS